MTANSVAFIETLNCKANGILRTDFKTYSVLAKIVPEQPGSPLDPHKVPSFKD
jgi:hypothetical protein